mgnify:CR=1 FL=1
MIASGGGGFNVKALPEDTIQRALKSVASAPGWRLYDLQTDFGTFDLHVVQGNHRKTLENASSLHQFMYSPVETIRFYQIKNDRV